MLQNAYFLAKVGADTAENEQHFADILPTDAFDHFEWRFIDRLNDRASYRRGDKEQRGAYHKPPPVYAPQGLSQIQTDFKVKVNNSPFAEFKLLFVGLYALMHAFSNWKHKKCNTFRLSYGCSYATLSVRWLYVRFL